MSANTIITSIVTGGTNNHTTVAEEANTIATDFVSQGVVGAITLNTGSGGTGSFCVNADSTADMGVTIKAGQAYISATPASQDSQVLRARASADYTEYTINANSSGVTKYDWIYLSVDATNANSPDAAADNVTSIYTSRSSSNTVDNGTPPTYGLLLAVVTVANGASSITNSNISDKRVNTSIGAQGGSLIVTQEATGDNAIVQAAGQDANISLQLLGKGTGTVILPNGAVTPAAWTNPYKFSVYRSAALTTGAASTWQLLTFDTETFDTSSNYSTSTGKFTVPVAGFYQFNVSTGIYSANSYFAIALYKNGSEVSQPVSFLVPNSGSNYNFAFSKLLSLAADDYIQIYTYCNLASQTINLAHENTFFEGFLVSES